MKLKKAIKYNLVVTSKSMIIFYSVVAAVYIFLAIIFTALDGIQGNSSMEFAAMIFLFTVGVVFFSEYFKMFLQNGVSRKTMFLSVTASLLIGAAIMSLLDTLTGLFLSRAGIVTPLTRMLYTERIADLSVVQSTIEIFFLNLMIYFLMTVLGYFTGILFAKLSRLMRVVLPVGLMVVFVVTAVADLNLAGGGILNAVGNFFVFISGFKNGGNMNYLTVSCLCFSVVFLALSWLMVRRATVNETK